ncbi:MAG: 23S rRNA (guanosine(2251)-2'-O)-methyltransferase RlmB [Proteobacteria bacterium]|nr:23S rRNA (guanosine(2251)-2'-O)-methyltransferase RlmB [Pseudomonadota bacterium]MDA0994002.1 23S rRNA (guanosine(2251)-2'-O)-methyltransferase RlmB [Pseudomonadota bacterium]
MSKAKYVTGLRAVEQLLSQRATEVLRIFAEYQTANPRLEQILSVASSKGIEIQPANRARLHQISEENRHQGVVAEIRRSRTMDEGALRSLVEERLTRDQPLLLLVLDGIQDPHNLGACLRTADAAGVDAVVVPRHGAAGLGPTVSKVAAGAAENVPFAVVSNTGKTLAWVGEYGISIVGTSDAGQESLYDCDLSGSTALVMGQEHAGLRKSIAERCDKLVSLPMHGSVSSLNVSVATGICLYEVVRQRRK